MYKLCTCNCEQLLSEIPLHHQHRALPPHYAVNSYVVVVVVVLLLLLVVAVAVVVVVPDGVDSLCIVSTPLQ